MRPEFSRLSRPRPLRAGSFRLASLLFVFVTACWGGTETREAPSLAEQVATADRDVQTVVQKRQSIEKDVALFFDSTDRFFELPENFWVGVPRDLFKHAAMSCLNAGLGGDEAHEPESPARIAASRFGVECVVMPLGPLWSRTETERRQGLSDTIQHLDRARMARNRLKSSFRSAPVLVNAMRVSLSDRRARLRQIEDEMQRRKPEYSSSEYSRGLDQISDYREDLRRLEKTLDELEKTIPIASRKLTLEVERVYVELAAL